MVGPAGTLCEIADEYRPCLAAGSSTKVYIVHLAGEAIGLIQSYVAKGSGDGWWADEQDPGVRGIDQFLANASQLGQGLGSAMVAAFVETLLSDPAVTHVQTDPSPRNLRAIRCYRRAGFIAIGERLTPDGPALLMRRYRRSMG